MICFVVIVVVIRFGNLFEEVMIIVCIFYLFLGRFLLLAKSIVKFVINVLKIFGYNYESCIIFEEMMVYVIFGVVLGDIEGG